MTLFLPSCGLVVLLAVWRTFNLAFDDDEEEDENEKEKEMDNKEDKESTDPNVMYHIFQMCAYAFMALMIMRLKLFLTPQMCILVGVLADKKV